MVVENLKREIKKKDWKNLEQMKFEDETKEISYASKKKKIKLKNCRFKFIGEPLS